MVNDKYISENKIGSFKKGDTVLITNTCHEGQIYDGKLWKCQTDSFFDKSGEDVVFMADFDGGCFLSKFLQKINIWI